MDACAVNDILAKYKEELKSELCEEFGRKFEKQKQQIYQQQQLINQQQELIESLTACNRRLADPRLFFFTDGASNTGSEATQDPVVRAYRDNQKLIAARHTSCVACGALNTPGRALTCTHIIPISDVPGHYAIWGTDSTIANYATDLDPHSSANLLMLCGATGEANTCREAYNKHIISLYYDYAADAYMWWVRLADWRTHDGQDIHGSHRYLADPKYKRILAWRTLAAAVMSGVSRQTNLERSEFIDFLQASEEDEMVYST